MSLLFAIALSGAAVFTLPEEQRLLLDPTAFTVEGRDKSSPSATVYSEWIVTAKASDGSLEATSATGGGRVKFVPARGSALDEAFPVIDTSSNLGAGRGLLGRHVYLYGGRFTASLPQPDPHISFSSDFKSFGPVVVTRVVPLVGTFDVFFQLGSFFSGDQEPRARVAHVWLILYRPLTQIAITGGGFFSSIGPPPPFVTNPGSPPPPISDALPVELRKEAADARNYIGATAMPDLRWFDRYFSSKPPWLDLGVTRRRAADRLSALEVDYKLGSTKLEMAWAHGFSAMPGSRKDLLSKDVWIYENIPFPGTVTFRNGKAVKAEFSRLP